MRLVQLPYKIGRDNCVVGGHCYQNLNWHILWELLARKLRRARVFARQFSCTKLAVGEIHAFPMEISTFDEIHT